MEERPDCKNNAEISAEVIFAGNGSEVGTQGVEDLLACIALAKKRVKGPALFPCARPADPFVADGKAVCSQRRITRVCTRVRRIDDIEVSDILDAPFERQDSKENAEGPNDSGLWNDEASKEERGEPDVEICEHSQRRVVVCNRQCAGNALIGDVHTRVDAYYGYKVRSPHAADCKSGDSSCEYGKNEQHWNLQSSCGEHESPG